MCGGLFSFLVVLRQKAVQWKRCEAREEEGEGWEGMTTQPRGLEEVLKASRWERLAGGRTKERQKLESGAGGQWRGRKRGDRRGERSFRVAVKTTEALQEFGNQWTLLYPPSPPLLIPLSINVRKASWRAGDAFPMSFNTRPINPSL